MTGIREFAAKIRNLFSTGEFQKRYGEDGRVQVMTHTERVLEKTEAFPYGFYAKAKSGRVLVFCQGGNYNNFEILPVLKADGVAAPELDAGDAALYTGEGGCVIVREAGGVEVLAGGSGPVSVKTEKGTFVIKNDGKMYLGNEQADICALVAGLIDEIKGIVTSGSPASQTVNPATRQKLEAYKNKVKELFAEAE
jgi:phage gp45-like